jgi:hypothetical protein
MQAKKTNANSEETWQPLENVLGSVCADPTPVQAVIKWVNHKANNLSPATSQGRFPRSK